MEILIQLNCAKIFIKITSLMDFDENFDAFAPAIIFMTIRVIPFRTFRSKTDIQT